MLRTKERLLEIRERILNGARFDMMARMYSVDTSSALKGGELQHETRAYKHIVEMTNLKDYFREPYFAEKKVVYVTIK